MFSARIHALAFLIGSLSLACGGPPTQIVVVVDSELPVPAEIDQLTLLVTRESDATAVVDVTVELDGPNAKALPVTFSLSQSGGPPGPLTIYSQTLHAGHVVTRRRATGVVFVPGEIMMLRMDVLHRCRSDDTCPAPDPLQAWQGPPAAWNVRADVGGNHKADAGRRADGAADAGSVSDAGGLPTDTDPNACVAGCEQQCRAKAQCTTVCPADQDCSLACVDEGTSCELQATAAKTSSLTCKQRARCTVAVKKQSKEGRAVCEDNAWCDMLCESPSCQLDCRNAQCRMRTSASASIVRVTCAKGSDCSLDFAGSEDAEVVCNGSTCSVMCRGSARCDMKCLGNASCLLSCEGGSSCDLNSCPAKQQLNCGNGVFACGRACP